MCPVLCLLSFGLNTVLLGRDCWFILGDDYVFRTLGPYDSVICQTCGYREGDSVVSKFGTKIYSRQ